MTGTVPLDNIQVYTDGGCDPNPGPGGWGAVLIFGLKTKDLSGADPDTTNNRMELTAALQALRALTRPCSITLHTDSRYLQRGITEWLPGWQNHNWHKANGRPVENMDLWKELAEEITRHQVDWQWVKGHTGHPLNERADQLATEARNALVHHKVAARPIPARAPSISPEQLPSVTIYTRACALGVPGPAGYAAVLVTPDGQTQLVSGGWELATSNVMELWAAVASLRSLKQRSRITLSTSSKYLFENITQRLAEWERNHWHTKLGQAVKNQEIWRELALVQGDHDVTWKLVTGDDGEFSQQAARAARTEAERQAASHPH
jgi:ribonuclease HI